MIGLTVNKNDICLPMIETELRVHFDEIKNLVTELIRPLKYKVVTRI